MVPKQLRSLAHPMRLKLLELLRTPGPWNCTRLAQSVGESTAAISYHLRQLAEAGFIAPDDQVEAKGRERWWKATSDNTVFPAMSPKENVGALAEVHVERIRKYAATAPHPIGALNDWRLRLTPDEMAWAGEQLRLILEKLRRDDGRQEAPEDAIPIIFQYQAIPV